MNRDMGGELRTYVKAAGFEATINVGVVVVVVPIKWALSAFEVAGLGLVEAARMRGGSPLRSIELMFCSNTQSRLLLYLSLYSQRGNKMGSQQI